MELSEEQTQGIVLSFSYALSNLTKLTEKKGSIRYGDVRDAIAKFADILELRGMILSTAIKPFIEKTMEEYSKSYLRR
jgi:hypothetical protein